MEAIGDYEKVGEWIREERKRQKRSQVDIADNVGYTTTHICRIEKGLCVPTWFCAQDILNTLGYRMVLGVEKIEDK